MIRRRDERKIDHRDRVRGGEGVTVQMNVMNSVEELNGKGRTYAHMLLAPGNSMGFHEHVGETESYYILKGTAEYSENGVTTELHEGDIALCPDGEGHGIKNIGDGDLEFMALILYN